MKADVVRNAQTANQIVRFIVMWHGSYVCLCYCGLTNTNFYLLIAVSCNHMTSQCFKKTTVLWKKFYAYNVDFYLGLWLISLKFLILFTWNKTRIFFVWNFHQKQRCIDSSLQTEVRHRTKTWTRKVNNAISYQRRSESYETSPSSVGDGKHLKKKQLFYHKSCLTWFFFCTFNNFIMSDQADVNTTFSKMKNLIIIR